MTGCEIWLCRVLLHRGRAGAIEGRRMNVADLHDAAHQAVLAKVVSGELGVLPNDGAIVEPVQSFRTEVEAQAERAKRMHDKPGEDWRVVITLAVSK